jgi:anti-sigma factor RsiW
MTCPDYRELLTDYQHGELDAARDAALFDHLQSCADCREELEAQNALTESLRAALATDFEMPTAVLAGVRQAVRREKASGIIDAVRALLRPAVLAPTAAAIIVAAGVASYVHSTSSAPQLSADYYVRQHVVHTMDSQSGDRAWNAYLLTSNTDEGANASAP